MWQGELVGVINISSPEAKAFDKQSLLMLEQIAVQAAIAITNAYRFKEQEEMQRRLASIEQVVAMGDMASNMVHNINNWVGSIRVNADYLLSQHQKGQIDRDELIDILDDILKNAQTTLAMAENINNRFKPLASEQIAEEIDINKCIFDALENMQIGVLRELQLKTVLSDDLPKVLASQQLRLVFENLINNALQAMNSQGSLELSTRTSKDGQWVEAVVSDSGPGLVANMNENDIFNFGVTSRKGGLGFGLWWCDTFLRRWGGDIQLVENSKRGCKFLVRLPSIEYNLPIGSQG